MANNYQIGFYASISNLKTIESQVTQIQKKINSVSGMDKQIKSAKESSKVFNEMFKAQDLQISKNYQKYYNDLAGGINNQTKSARASANVFKELFATTKDGAKGFSDLQKKVVDLSGGLEIDKKASMTFSSRIKEAMKASVEWAVAMGVLYGAIHRVREAMETVIALDNQMTNIRMVTGASIEQAEEYLKVYQNIADQTSSTTIEVAKSAETWLRQGRSIQETNELIKTSSVFAKVAFLDSAEAATLLTSAINGYGLSAQDAMNIVDKLSAVDVNAATGADDLARALRQTASSAKIAGVGMDDLLGYIAVVQDVTQKSADSIGNSFKTIFARIQQVRLGSLFDQDGESISNVETVLKQYGITLREVDGTFKDTSGILDELNEKWQTLNSAQKSEISTTIAGVRQRENFLVLMENYGKAMELSAVSANSAGSALEKFDIYQESTQAKLSELTNQFQIFANNMIESGFIKSLIDAGKYLLMLANTGMGQVIIKGTALITTLTLLNFAFGVLQKKISASNFMPVFTAFKQLIVSGGTLKGVIDALTLAVSKNPIFMPALIIGSIFTLIQALDKIPTAMEKQISKVQKLTDNLASLKSEYDGLKSKSDLTDLEKARLSLLEAELETQKELVKVESQRQYDMSKNTTSSAPTVSRGDFANFNVSTIQQTVEAYTNLKKQVASTKDEEYKRQQALASMTTEMTSYAQNLVSLKEKGVELTEEDKKLLELILRITEAQNKQSTSNNDLANSTELLNSVVNEYNNALELLQEVEDKSREGTGLTLEKKDELLQKYPQLEDAVYKMATGWGVEQEAIDALRSSLTKTAQDQASSEASRTENAKQNTLARLKLIQAEITALSSLSNSLKSYSPSLFGMAEKAIGDIPDLSKGGSPYKLSGTKQNVLQNEANILQQQVALAEKALTNAFGLVSGVHGSKTGSAKKDSSKSSTDAWKEAFDKQYKLLQHQLTMNEITESQYLDKLDVLYKKYFANKTKYTDEFMQYEEEVYTKRKKLEEELLKERLEAQKETIEKQKDALESLIDKTVELMKSEYDAEKQHYNDLIDQENKKHDDKMDNLKSEIQAKKDALEAELDGYRKIIESQLESLRLKDEERSYNKDLSERQKELAKLESELLEVSMDDTAEGRAKRLELEEKLAEKRLDIEDLQHDRGLTLQEQALQDELKRYEEATQSKLDKYDKYLETEEERYEESLENRVKEYQDHIKEIDNYLKQEGRMRQDAMARIESGEKNLFDKLLEYNLVYGDGTKKSFVDIWETATSALDKYADKQLSVLEILGQMDSDLTGIDLTLSGKGSTSGQLSAKGKEQLNQQKYLHDLMVKAQKEGNKNLEKWIVAERLKWGMDKYGAIKQQYHDGGLVGGSTSLKSGEVVAKLLNGELVSTSSQMDTFIHDTLPKMLGISSYANEFSGIKIDMPINFAGGLDNSTLPEFKNVVETAVNKAFDKLNSAMYKKGNIRNAKSLSI